LQEFWSKREIVSHSVESLAAVFRCLLIIESFKEAQVFLSDNFRQLSPIDQASFRTLTAAGALRHLVSLALGESEDRESSGSAKGSSKVASEAFAVLSMAIQLNPESIELLSLLERFAKSKDEDDLMVLVKNVLRTGSFGGGSLGAEKADGSRSMPAPLDVGVGSLLIAVQGLGAGTFDQDAEHALAAALKMSPAFGIAASRLAIRLNAAGTVSAELAVRWLRAINTASPDLLVAWSDRASLHLKNGQTKEAIACYDFLLEKLPGNEQIKEALVAARLQLQKSH